MHRLAGLVVLGSLAAGTLALADDSASPEAGPSPTLAWEVVSRRPHDGDAFTQGLVLAPTGRLYESTGLLGESSIREVDPVSGEVLRRRDLPDSWFGEGLALVGHRLVQLTWRNGIARAWDADTFEPLARYEYDGEGWGLCHDGLRLVMSDGSAELTFRDPATFGILGSVDVTSGGRPVDRLNELECVGGAVWANVYPTDDIVRLDPATGVVTGILRLEGLLVPRPADRDPGAVLNGIAHDAVSDTFLVTGKRWPELIEIRVSDPPQAVPAAPAGRDR